MDATGAETAAPPLRRPAALVAALGCGTLLARPVAVRAFDEPTAVLLVLFVALGVAGWRWPVDDEHDRSGLVAPAVALALGVGAFAVGRLFAARPMVALPLPVAPLLLNGLAAVAEEAFFRRLVYGLLAPRGVAVAVGGSALCFAAVHLTVWGVAVLPLDLAAGLVLGWQRAATGRWSVPAATHVAANVLAVL